MRYAEGRVIEAMILNGLIQSPSIALLADRQLKLIPIVGKPIEINLNKISDIKAGRWFNGSLLIGKAGYRLKVSGFWRLGFAVPNHIAKEWNLAAG